MLENIFESRKIMIFRISTKQLFRRIFPKRKKSLESRSPPGKDDKFTNTIKPIYSIVESDRNKLQISHGDDEVPTTHDPSLAQETEVTASTTEQDATDKGMTTTTSVANEDDVDDDATEEKQENDDNVPTDPDNDEEIYYDDEDEDDIDDLPQMTKVYNSQTQTFKLPLPLDPPEYMRDKPEFAYKETKSYQKRRNLAVKNLKNSDVAVKNSKYGNQKDQQRMNIEKSNKNIITEKQRKVIEPKSNKAFDLREKYIKKRPIITSQFKDHFSQFRKPPFVKVTKIISSFADGDSRKIRKDVHKTAQMSSIDKTNIEMKTVKSTKEHDSRDKETVLEGISEKQEEEVNATEIPPTAGGDTGVPA